MGTIKVFHGSDHVIKKPLYHGGRSDNDYGNGFYTTEYEDRARSWAALNGSQEQSIVNAYTLDLTGLTILDLNDFGILSWIAEVVANRGTYQETTQPIADPIVEHYQIDSKSFDIIKGYRADDSYTQVIEAFLMNQINTHEVQKLFYKGKLRNQIFLKSEKAFSQIYWIGAYSVTLQDTDTSYDYRARREVNQFLSQRTNAILMDGYQVPGITARYAIQNKLVYNREGDYYDNTCV